MSDEIKQDLQTYIANIRQFCMASNFQKMVLSMIVGMRKQKEELQGISRVFQLLDKDNDGMLTKEELKDGLKKYNVFDLLKGNQPEKYQKT